jgi:TonB-linked SusC/RagA family outer membrane protein
MAQTKVTLTGKVTAAGNEPLIGVTVMEKGTTNGTMTDIDGNYTLLNVPENATIVYSMIGLITKEVKMDKSGVINVVMEDNTKMLDDVVVIGYGVVKKSDLTSSITTVKGEALKNMTSGNALYSMQGKANGVQITGSGGPGDSPRVIIRGVTTINGSDPLYVVDGVPMADNTNINFLNQNDIESIEVLKDASSAAIYGTRGANGVILVTTKKGSEGKVKFQVSASLGMQTLSKPDMANAATYEKVFKERYENDKAKGGGNAPWDVAGIGSFSDTDWWNQTVNDVAYTQSYNFSFQGGTDKFVYSGSLGYFRQNSQFDVGYWERITGRFNTEYKFNSIVKAGIDFAPRYENWDDTPNLFDAIMRMDPTTPVYRASEDRTANEYDNYARSYHNQVWNPAGSTARQNSHSNEYGLMMNPYLSIEPIKGLVARTQFSVNARFRMTDNYTPKFYIDNLEQSEQSKIERNSNHWVDWTWTNTLNYMRTFNEKHNLNLMGGFTMEKFAEYWLTGSREAVPNNHQDLQYVNAGTLNPQASGTDVYTSYLSYLGRVMYNYDNRYYLTASIRSDGSSLFPKGNKYATFPAASVAWRVSEEGFMKNQNIVSNLKVRAGWGQVGNTKIDPNSYLNLIDGTDYVFNSDRYVGTSISSVGNPTLMWEKVEDYNLGIDAGFLDNRLDITADVFLKKSKDMLIRQRNLMITGFPMWEAQMWSNIGTMEAKGWELSINWKDQMRDFNYEVGVNLSSVKNSGKNFGLTTEYLNGEFFNEYIIKNEAGGEISRFYGYVTDGIFQNWTEINSHTSNTGELLQPDAVPGDIRFKDLNNDGVFDEKDKTYIGSAFPDLMVGLNIRMGYKNFDLVSNFYGTVGNDIYNSAKGGFYAGTEGQNVFADAYDKAWRGEGTSNYYPRLSYTDANLNYRRVSSFFVEDGSYFRCKLLQIGYTLPTKMTKGLGIRLSASAQNLFTITSYSGMDPERAAMGSALEAGIDNLGYPNPRTFLFGLNINF